MIRQRIYVKALLNHGEYDRKEWMKMGLKALDPVAIMANFAGRGIAATDSKPPGI